MEEAAATGRIVPIARAIFHVAATGIAGFAAAFGLLTGYLIGFGFILVAVMKPIFRTKNREVACFRSRPSCARCANDGSATRRRKRSPLFGQTASALCSPPEHFPGSNPHTSRDKGIAVISGR
jgi:hypothetical protein